MTRYTRVRLEPRGPFHFGGRGVGMEHSEVRLPADSLFSALCVVIAETHGAAAVQTLLAQFPTADARAQPPFRLTSLMPYAGEVFLLPYPMIGPPQVAAALDLRKRKRFKAIRWASQDVFVHLAAGQPPAGALDAGGSPVTDRSAKVWLTEAERQKLAPLASPTLPGDLPRPVLWRSGVRPRVTVDRVSSASAVYASGATEFSRSEDGTLHVGLYTVIEWLEADPGTQQMIRGAFELLGHAGIGGERSSGHGQFTPHLEELAAWSPGAGHGSYFATLSPYHPTWAEREVVGPGARYEIVLRRGWLSLPGYSNLRRASVRMIADGSVLHLPGLAGVPGEAEPIGELVDVTPEKLKEPDRPTIYRYGLAFPVRIADAAMDLTPRPPFPPSEVPRQRGEGGRFSPPL
jgi:CRISPR-associated protein Csm4